MLVPDNCFSAFVLRTLKIQDFNSSLLFIYNLCKNNFIKMFPKDPKLLILLLANKQLRQSLMRDSEKTKKYML